MQNLTGVIFLETLQFLMVSNLGHVHLKQQTCMQFRFIYTYSTYAKSKPTTAIFHNI